MKHKSLKIVRLTLASLVLSSSSCLLLADSMLASVTPTRFVKGLIWRIEKAGVDASYLFGTMHTDGPGIRNIIRQAEPYLQQARTVCTEIKMDFEALAVELQAMFFTDGRTLNQVLADPALYQAALARARQHGLQEEMVRHMKPFTLAFMLSMPMSQGQVLDSQIYTRAMRDNKNICGLETIAEHRNTFTAFDMPAQIVILKNAIANYDEYQSIMPQLLEAYLQRDLGKIVTLASGSMMLGDEAITRTFIQRFLIERNRIMVKRMQPYLQQGQAFFAVGAMHLTGEAGILQLLQQQGYQISAVY